VIAYDHKGGAGQKATRKRDINALWTYERCGHSAIMGIIHRPWQDCDRILGYFGKSRKRAIEKYEQFVEECVKAGRRPG
jgi:hypothetical protein